MPTRPTMPKGEHVRIVLTVQKEPLSGRTCAYAISARGLIPVLGENPPTVAEVAPTGSIADTDELERKLIETLHGLLAAVDEYNFQQRDDWHAQRTLQVYAFDRFDIRVLVDLLLRAATASGDSECAEQALALLFYLQGPELLTAPQQPDPAGAAFPILSIVDSVRNLLALPVEVAYRLSDLSRLLPPGSGGFEYHASKRLTAPLSSQLRPDPVLKLWQGDQVSDLAAALTKELRARVWAMGSVVDGVRHALEAGDALFAWPPKFQLPGPRRFQHPLLSRLAFLARYESVLAYLGVRMARTLPLGEQVRRGTLLPLAAHRRREIRRC